MFSALLATSLLLALPEDEFLVPGMEAELELVSIVGTTGLSLVNPTASPALVHVSGEDGDRLASLVVPARGELNLEFPRHTLAGTTMTLVAVGPHGRLFSGALAIDGIVESGYRAVWFESVGRAVHAWGELPTGPGYIDPLPGSFNSLAPPPISPKPHVPVVTPANKPRGDMPPKIESKPLPPV